MCIWAFVCVSVHRVSLHPAISLGQNPPRPPALTLESRHAWQVNACGVVFSRRRTAQVRWPSILGGCPTGTTTLSLSWSFPCRSFIFSEAQSTSPEAASRMNEGVNHDASVPKTSENLIPSPPWWPVPGAVQREVEPRPAACARVRGFGGERG